MTNDTQVRTASEQIEDAAPERKKIQDIKRVHVATPAYDGKVDSDFAASMLMAGQLCSLQLIECSSSIIGNGAFIEIARNVLVKEFLTADRLKEFTHFMFIDSDLQFEPRAIAGLVRAGHSIAVGAYRRRQEPEDFPCVWTPMPNSGTGRDNPPRLWMENGWLRVHRAPTGFMCIERGVLEVMTKEAVDNGRVINLPDKGPTPWLFYTKIDENNRFVGEDYCFCDDYMALLEAGKYPDQIRDHILCWPDFDFVHGGYPCNYLDFLDRKVKEVSGKTRRKGRKR